MPLDRPILVTGTPRAGKSLVWRTIRSAAEFLSVEEPITIWDAGLHGPDDARRESALANPAVAQRIRSRIEQLVAESGKERYCENLSYHALRLPFVHAVLPEARFIHVIRDPHDAVPEILFGWQVRSTVRTAVRHRRGKVDPRAMPRLVWKFARNYVRSRAHGRRESWGPTPPGLREFAPGRSTPEIAAYQWRRIVEIALEDLGSLPDVPVLEIRYHELTADPAREAARIAAFVEAEDPESLVAHAKSMIEQRYVHYEPCRASLSAADWELVRRITDPLRKDLGFEGVSPAWWRTSR